MSRSRAIPVGAVVAWSLFSAYLGLVSTVTRVEVLVGAVLAVATAVLAVVAARAFETSCALPRLRWRWLWTFPVDAAWDAVRLGQRRLGRGPSQRQRDGWWETVELPQGAGHADAVRAYVVLVVSWTPASYVADVAGDDGWANA